MFFINTIRNVVVNVRTSLRLLALIIIGILVILCVFLYVFRPTYSVTLNGEFIGYSANKSKLQSRINDYMESGEGDNVAFVKIEQLPEYQMCLLKKGEVTNDDEIFEIVKNTGTVYYEYYAITLDEEEKKYVATYDDAKAVIDELKEKKSTNIEKLGMVKKYETSLEEFTEKDEIVSDLFVKPVEAKKVTTYASSGSYSSYKKTVNTSGSKVNLGISLIRPISGTITSRFAYRSSGLHTGLDIATKTGTPIKAAASGTVTFSGTTTSGYGKYIVISHGNGIETYYAHCSALYVKAGQQVSQGETIAAVGSTGNSTGPHLHLEIRVNGACQNPQNYLY